MYRRINAKMEYLPGVTLASIPKFADDRGNFLNIDLENLKIPHEESVSRILSFDKQFKRSYIISNHRAGIVRAFHGHEYEGKLFYVPRGAFKFIILEMTSDIPPTQRWEEYVLSADVPKLLWVPKGYYNGFVSLTDDNLLICFSTSTMEESREDDCRLPYDKLGKEVWEIKNR
jgi:dTDP-4-dehydrorhamnose 3,5-epimerase